MRFSQRLLAILSVCQMIERTQEQDRIYGFVLPWEGAGVTDVRAGEGGLRLTSGRLLGQLYVQRADVDEMHGIALFGKPASMTARPAADIQDRGGRRGEKALEELARAF